MSKRAGKFVTPGIIDTHSHLGVYAAPDSTAHSDGNEMTAPTTAQARAEYRTRQIGLGASIAVIGLLMLAITLKLRRLEGRDSRQSEPSDPTQQTKP